MGYREPDLEEQLACERIENAALRAKLATLEAPRLRLISHRVRALLVSGVLLVALVSICPLTLMLYNLMGKVLAYFDITDNVGQPFATGGVIVAVVVAVAFGVDRWNKST